MPLWCFYTQAYTKLLSSDGKITTSRLLYIICSNKCFQIGLGHFDSLILKPKKNILFTAVA